MPEYTLKIDLGGYWHAGTGRGDGAGADAVVARDTGGLPYLPGSHLRGLWRHAVRLLETLGHTPRRADGVDWTDALFGRAAGGAGETESASASPVANRFETTAGAVAVSDGRLADRVLAAALAHKGHAELRARLTPTVQSTAISEDGIVTAQTLRSIEVAVPLPLAATVTVHGSIPPEGVQVLRDALGLITHVGKHRTRGLGRARLTLEVAK